MHSISKKSSFFDVFQKQRASFIKDEELNEVFFSEPRKNAIVKHIESYKPKERCQAGTVLLSK